MRCLQATYDVIRGKGYCFTKAKEYSRHCGCVILQNVKTEILLSFDQCFYHGHDFWLFSMTNWNVQPEMLFRQHLRKQKALSQIFESSCTDLS